MSSAGEAGGSLGARVKGKDAEGGGGAVFPAVWTYS